MLQSPTHEATNILGTQRRLTTLRFPAEPVVSEDDRYHGFRHWNKASEQARVVTTFRANGRWLRRRRDRSLFDGEAAGRLDGGTQNDRLARGDAAKDAAMPIRFC